MSDSMFILTLTCADTVGIVAATASCLVDSDAFILESQQYADEETGRFFMRVAFRQAGQRSLDLADLRARLAPIAQRFDMTWSVVDARHKMRIAIAVSRAGHCLNDLLHRWRTGSLPVEIALVISNHLDLRDLTTWHDVPFVHLPVADANRGAQESRMLDLIGEANAELLVLARYMQVLSPAMCAALAWRCVNIHHSFLPSFRGAQPYHQAHRRGVKLIGATAHYVTSDLDEGPIIEQAIERVDHATTAERMVTAGRDVESIVLARAVTWAAERRILPNGTKTVVFRR